ncbi:MAG: alkaline phosphatase family protein [Anaerolineae bacterium]|nr:alkaline phosphatase family protein [Anaerolineae bacterium]
MRVLVIGIDGATFRLMRPLMQQGYMPYLTEVERRGALGTLETIYPPVTAPAWSSFMTGKNPGKHGVYEFLHRKRGTLEQIPVNAGMLGSETLWEIMSKAGKRMVVVSVPLCYPPFPVNGTLMSDFLAPMGARDLSYPPELLNEVEEKFGEYLLYHKQVYTKDNVANVLAELEEHTAYRQRVAEYLLKRDPWDFAMVYFEGTDRLQHELWHVIDPTSPMHDPQEAAQYGERTRNYYRELDNDVRQLVELAQSQDPSTQVILMSDHGFGAIHKFVNFNIWLLREGFLKLKQDIPTQLKHALFSLGFTPSLGYKLSMNFGFANLRLSQGMTNRNQILDLVRRGFLSFRNVDWKRTRAFSSGNYGQIFVNLEGREPYGSVPASEFDRVVEQIGARLLELRDLQTGAPVVAKVYKRSDVFWGEFIDDAPDVVFSLTENYKALGTLEFASNKVVEPAFGNSGDHRMDGFVGMLGTNIRQGVKIENANIMDVAPTILYLMGLPIPADLDGHVLTAPLREELLMASQIMQSDALGARDQLIPDYTEEESEEVKERLRALGYLG